MNLKEALKIIKDRGWWTITPVEGSDDRFISTLDNGTFPEELTSREVINLARDYTSDCRSNTRTKSNVKHFGKRKNRAAERDAINTEDFDSIPQIKGRKGRVKDADIWSWD